MADRPTRSERDAQDQELIARIARGERAALAALFQAYAADLRRLAYRFLGDWDAADDICQEVFLRVRRSAAAFTPAARVSTWLYRIVANLCWDFRRRRRTRRTEPLEAGHALHADAESPEPPDTALQTRVRAAVAALPDRQRLALILHRYEGLSHQEIAEMLGWSVKSVESCLVRAYRHLRTALQDLIEEH